MTNGGCFYLYGRVPFPVLGRFLFVIFLGFGLVWFKLLLRHFDHGVLRLLQLSPLLGRSLPTPAHLEVNNVRRRVIWGKGLRFTVTALTQALMLALEGVNKLFGVIKRWVYGFDSEYNKNLSALILTIASSLPPSS